MAQTGSEEDNIDLGALAALTRSTQSLGNKEDEDTVDIKALVAAADAQTSDSESASLDLKALLAAPPEAAVTEKPADAAKAEVKTPNDDPFATAGAPANTAKKEAKTEPKTAKAAPAAGATSSKPTESNGQASGSKLPIAIAAIAAAAIGGYFVMKPTAPIDDSADAPEIAAVPENAVPQPPAEVAPSVPTAPVEAPADEVPTAAIAPAAAAIAETEAPSQPAERRAREPVAEATPAARAQQNAPSTPVAEARTRREEPAPAARQATAPEARTVAAEPARPAAQASATNLLDQAFGRPAAAPAAAAPAAAALPDTPSQGDVRRVIGALMPRMRECAGETTGNASAILMLRSDGTVASASVAGPPLGGGTIGGCLEGVLRSAQFPAFRQQTFRVQYPISVRPLTP